MGVYSFAGKQVMQQVFAEGLITDSQILSCDFDGLETAGTRLHNVQMRNTNANENRYAGCSFAGCEFSQSSLMKSTFSDCAFTSQILSGLTLIRTQWSHCRLDNISLDMCTLQRTEWQNVVSMNGSYSDFEAISAKLRQCVFYRSTFTITATGMNGFSGGKLENNLFIGCTFSGYPLRGAQLENCTFIGCRGEIGDDMSTRSVYGLPRVVHTDTVALQRRAEAAELLNTYGKAGN